MAKSILLFVCAVLTGILSWATAFTDYWSVGICALVVSWVLLTIFTVKGAKSVKKVQGAARIRRYAALTGCIILLIVQIYGLPCRMSRGPTVLTDASIAEVKPSFSKSCLKVVFVAKNGDKYTAKCPKTLLSGFDTQNRTQSYFVFMERNRIPPSFSTVVKIENDSKSSR
jgi:hypothetical protein